MEIEWVDEVPERQRRGRWQQICDQLRTKPGKWARVHQSSNTSFASMLKSGALGDGEPGEFEATCRRNAEGTYDIYARYVGKQAKD